MACPKKELRKQKLKQPSIKLYLLNAALKKCLFSHLPLIPLRCYLSCSVLSLPPPEVHRDLPGHQRQPHGQHVYRRGGVVLLTGGQKPSCPLGSKSWQLFLLWRGRFSFRAPGDLRWPAEQLLPLLPPPLAPHPAGDEDGRPGEDQ